MDIVLVHSYVRAGREGEFFASRKDSDVQGFLKEDLYRHTHQPEPGVVEFLNVGRWESRAQFEERFGSTPAGPEGFEARRREREWLKPSNSN